MKPSVKVKIEATSEIREIRKKDKSGSFFVQKCFAHLGGVYPESIDRISNTRSEALAPGDYIATQLYLARGRDLVVGLRDLSPA